MLYPSSYHSNSSQIENPGLAFPDDIRYVVGMLSDSCHYDTSVRGYILDKALVPPYGPRDLSVLVPN